MLSFDLDNKLTKTFLHRHQYLTESQRFGTKQFPQSCDKLLIKRNKLTQKQNITNQTRSSLGFLRVVGLPDDGSSQHPKDGCVRYW